MFGGVTGKLKVVYMNRGYSLKDNYGFRFRTI